MCGHNYCEASVCKDVTTCDETSAVDGPRRDDEQKVRLFACTVTLGIVRLNHEGLICSLNTKCLIKQGCDQWSSLTWYLRSSLRFATWCKRRNDCHMTRRALLLLSLSASEE
ncbi:unnamed protein product [Fusarium graminearum]|nr:unnamed protein product [Fusarium graminearum]